MKKVFAIIFSILFFVSLSFAVVGCKKAEEQKPAEPAKTEAPAAPAQAPPVTQPPAPAQQSPLGGK